VIAEAFSITSLSAHFSFFSSPFFVLDSIKFLFFKQSWLHLGLTNSSGICIRAVDPVPFKVINPDDKCSVYQMFENLDICTVYCQNLKSGIIKMQAYISIENGFLFF
jgi:hypothetical protein